MLFMHCGWVRTGTSSLQAALVAHREELATAGVNYPDRWQLEGSDNHQGFIELLKGENGRKQLRRQLVEVSSSNDTVLLSAESLTYWLTGDNRSTLLSFLTTTRERLPVTCIWTLRNLVEVVNSMYLRHILSQHRQPRPADEFVRAFAARDGWPADQFTGQRRLEAGVDDTVYLRYATDGSHNRALLQTAGVPSRVSTSIERQLEEEPRLNARLSHKGAVVVLHRDQVSARLGFEIDKAVLTKAIYRGELKFHDDGPCRLFAGEAIAELHRRALSAARDSDFAPYLEFFGSDEPDTSPPVELDPDLLDENDLDRLAACLDKGPVESHGASPC